MDAITELKIEKAQNFELKKWVRLLIPELSDFNDYVDWRNNTCLKQILFKYHETTQLILERE